MNVENKTPIQEFFKGKTIFITGATGFIGKLLIECICRECFDINRIYVLIRKKKDKSAEERLENLLDDLVFASLKNDWKKKVFAVEGEIGEAEMDMSPENRQRLIDEVDIVFHSAATIRFDERLDVSLKVNVVGTVDVIQLCKQMKHLKSVVHVSTLFADCAHGLNIREKLSQPNIFFDDVLTVAKVTDGATLETLKHKIIEPWPNTYAFSKAAAEYMISVLGGDLPIIVFRPGLVLGTSGKHPACGYIDSIFGVSGLLVGVGLGVIRILKAISEQKTNLIPGDYCANGIIVSAWDAARKRNDEIPVINYVTEPEANITWGNLISLWSGVGEYMPTSLAIWWPNVEITGSTVSYNLRRLFVHILPALIVDSIARAMKQKPSVHRKIEKFFEGLRVFLWTDWIFQLNGMSSIRSRMAPEDRTKFYTDLSDLDWSAYASTIIHGVRYYLLKDDPRTIPASQKRFQRLKLLHYAVVYGCFAVLIGFMWLLITLRVI